MNDETYNQIINYVYKKWNNEIYTNVELSQKFESEFHDKTITYDKFLRDRFVKKIKTDKEFSEKWELKIEEEELSLEERLQLIGYKEQIIPKTIERYGEKVHKQNCDKNNIPTKKYTVIYKNNKIDFYE